MQPMPAYAPCQRCQCHVRRGYSHFCEGMSRQGGDGRSVCYSGENSDTGSTYVGGRLGLHGLAAHVREWRCPPCAFTYRGSDAGGKPDLCADPDLELPPEKFSRRSQWVSLGYQRRRGGIGMETGGGWKRYATTLFGVSRIENQHTDDHEQRSLDENDLSQGFSSRCQPHVCRWE